MLPLYVHAGPTGGMMSTFVNVIVLVTLLQLATIVP
jgi:hypothetical protein